MADLPVPTAVTTTLTDELAYYQQLTTTRLINYQLPKPTLPLHERIAQIICAHCAEGLKPFGEALENLKQIIAHHVERNQAIPLSISFAIAMRMNNPLKFNETQNAPTLGWLHFAWFFDLLNSKIRRIYDPGLHVYIFDEASLFGGLIERSAAEVQQLLDVTRMIFGRFHSVQFTLVPMLPEWFFSAPVVPTESEPPDGVIYGIACSLPQTTNPEFMAQLYANRQRDYRALSAMEPTVWSHAQAIAREVYARLEWRKRVRLFDHYIKMPFIDATVTEKLNGRVVLDISSGAFVNHGQPCVTRLPNGKYTFRVVPEYRIPIDHPEAQPVLISPAEFGYEGEKPFTFYYRLP